MIQTYIIDFKQDCTSSDIDSYMLRNNCLLKKVYDNFEKVFVVESATNPPIESIIESVINDAETAITPLDTALSIESLNVNTFDVQDDNNWWKTITHIDMDFTKETCTFSKFGKKITVYLLDSGVDLTHSEFVGQNISQIYTFNNNATDVNGHGTALASLITGNTTSLAEVKVVSLKIFEQGTPTPLSKLLEALDIVFNDSKNQQFALLNMSWSIPFNEYVNNKLLQLYYNANVGLVAAAGNNGIAIENITPASINECIVVGAFNKNLEPCDFSNFTSDLANTASTNNFGKIDVWAPGESIRVALPNNTYGVVAGTSFSAAIHSSAIASCIEIYASINKDELIPFDNFTVTQYMQNGHHFGRENILDLQGQYAISNNFISTLFGVDSVKSRIPFRPNISAVAGKLQYVDLLNSKNCKSLKLLNSLPPGFTLSDYGWIIGTHDTLPENTKYVSYPLSVEFTLNDNSITVKNYDFYIIDEITANNKDVPEELMWITAQGTACSFTSTAPCFVRCPTSNNIFFRYCTDLDGKGGCEHCCDAGNCCFTPETLITMADRSTKEIQHIKEDDSILVLNSDLHNVDTRKVKCVITRTNRPMHTLTLSDNTKLNLSEDHPLWVKGKEWCSIVPPETYKDLSTINRLEVGDVLLNSKGKDVKIVSIDHLDFPDTVYELDTTYFFANGILSY